MANYLIKKDNKTNEIIYMEYNFQGYSFIPSSKSDAYLKVNNVTIINPKMIEKIIALKFSKTFKKLAYMIMSMINEDDASDNDVNVALGEIDRMKGILEHKYNKFLKKVKEEEYLLKLEILEKELLYKQMLVNEKKLNNLETIKSRGR